MPTPGWSGLIIASLYKCIKKSTDKKIFMRFFVVFSILIIGFTFLSNAIVQRYTVKHFENKIKSFNVTILKNIISYVDENFNKLKRDILFFSSDSSFQKLIYGNNNETEHSTSYIALADRLNKFCDTHSMVEDALVYIPKTKILLSRDGLSNLDFFCYEDTEYKLCDILKQHHNFTVISTQNIIYKKYPYNSARLLTICTTFPLFQEPGAVMIVFINEEYIKELITGFSEAVKSSYLVLTAEGELVTSTGVLENINKDCIDNIYRKISLKNHNFDSFYMELDRSLFGTFHISESMEWNYISMISQNQIIKQTDYIKTIIDTVCYTFIVFGLVVSFLLSRGMYKPISSLINYLDKINNNNDKRGSSRINEFNLIKKRINSMNNANITLKKALNKERPFLVENLMFKVLQGNIINKKVITDKLDWYGISIKKSKNFCVVTARVDFLKNRKEAYLLDKPDTLKKINGIIYAMNSRMADCYTVEFDLCTTIYIFPDTYAEKIYGNCQSITEYFNSNRDLCVRITMGVGKSYPGILNIHYSFNESFMAMQNRSINRNSEVINYNSKIDSKTMNTLDIGGKLISVSNFLITNDFKNGAELSIEILEDSVSNSNTYITARSVMEAIIRIVSSYIEKRGYSFDDMGLNKNELFCNMRSFVYFFEFKNLISDLFNSIKEFNNNIHRNNKTDIVNFIIEYIQKNYNRDIYLESIAEEIHLSANYISHFFKKTVGISFSEYLGRIRIEKAKGLLKETDFTVKEVGVRVGFSNTDTFNRTFKKVEHITPGRYRVLCS